MLSVVHAGLAPVPWADLDPAMVQEDQRGSSGYTLDVLQDQLRPRDAVETTHWVDDNVVFDAVARKVFSGFSTVFLLLLLLPVGVGFPAALFGR